MWCLGEQGFTRGAGLTMLLGAALGARAAPGPPAAKGRGSRMRGSGCDRGSAEPWAAPAPTPACPLGRTAPRLSQSWLLAEGTVMGV